MSVLVTGGCGLIGAQLTRLLAEKGEQVHVLDINLRPHCFSGINDRMNFVQADLANFA